VAISIKILKKGDQVLNVWSDETGKYVAVKRETGEVYVYSVTLDENHAPRINQSSSFIITFGDGEIEATIPVSVEKIDEESQGNQRLSINDESVKVTTF
jgi:ribosomal protein L24